MNQDKFDIIVIDDTKYETKLTETFRRRKKYQKPDPRKVYAFIPGTIRNIFVKTGQDIKKGDKLLILEAMKMKNIVSSDFNGKVVKVLVSTDQIVAKNDLLVEME